MIFKDKSGRELQVGDIIAYGHALGRCPGIRYGKVLGFKEGKDITSYSYTDKKAVKVMVQGVDDDWPREAPKLATPSVLNFSSRILKVTPDQVSPKILALLEKVVTGEQATVPQGSKKGKSKKTKETESEESKDN
jgi:hypothetical protein